MPTAALELCGVRKRYGKRVALDGLDLQVPRGSVCGLVGSNGAGKTTAIAIAAGLVRPDAGDVSLFGEGPFDAGLHAGRVALMPQDSLMPPHARVAELLVFYASLQGIAAAEARRQTDRVLELVRLSDRARSPIRSLSHGMRRRVAIAQCFLGAPDLVLLDEPTSGLDPREVLNTREVLLHRRDGQTVLISSHVLNELERVCDHVAFVEKGKTLGQDAMDAVTGRRHTLAYRLRPGPIPLDALAAALPDAIFETAEGGASLVCRCKGSDRTTEEVNRLVLQTLIHAGVGIREVRLGSGLEEAYLDRHGREDACIGGQRPPLQSRTIL
jgi:ABC-2 type transport system ATP-binding protein